MRDAREGVNKRSNPFKPPSSASDIGKIQYLNQTFANSNIVEPPISNQKPAGQFSERFESRLKETFAEQAKREDRARLRAEKAAQIKAETGGSSSKSGRNAATALKSGAEIPSLAVGSNSPSPNLNNRPFGVNIRGYAIPIGVGTAIGFATNVAQGESIERAASRAAGQTAGAYAGAVVGGAIGGLLTLPAGGVGATVLSTAGSLIGSYLGDVAGGNLFDIFSPKQSPKAQIVKTKAVNSEPPPFAGGQSPGVAYIVVVRRLNKFNGAVSESIHGRGGELFGPVIGLRYVQDLGDGGITRAPSFQQFLDAFDASGQPASFIGTTGGGLATDFEFSIHEIRRFDGQPDTGGNLSGETIVRAPQTIMQSSPATPPTSFIDERPRKYGWDKMGLKQVPYSPPGDADLPNQKEKQKPYQIQIPGNLPISIRNGDTGTPTTITPAGDPLIIEIPRNTISADAGVTLTPQPLAIPITIKDPATNKPVTITTTGSGPLQLNLPGLEPIKIDPSGKTKPTGVIPTLEKPNQLVPTGFPIQEIKPIGAKPATPATDPTKPPTTPKPEEAIPGLENIKDPDLLILGTGLVTITQILKGINTNTSSPAIESAAAAANCRTAQPGGCTSKAMDDAVKKGNDDLIRKLNVGGQVADLALLGVINDKLGPQVPGGISGFLSRFAKSIHLDKIINALTLIAALHNAAMLSRSLGSTLGDLTGQALSVIGLKDEEGDAIDINKILSKKVDDLFISILGEAAWKGIKTTWNKANAIISSASQIVWTVRSLFDSGREILEWTAENTGRIGNALRRFRIVGENAYRWMPERVTTTNIWTQKVDRAREGIDSLDDAASSLSSVLGEVQNIQQEAQELKEQKERFDKNLKEFTPKEREDNEPVKAAVEAGRTASKAPTDAADAFRGEGELDA